MAKFGLTLVWIWAISFFVAWAYFWFTKTNSSQSAIARRGIALGHALIWPVIAFKAIRNNSSGATAQKQSDLKAAEGRILRGNPTGNNQQNAARPQGGSSIKNPFDN